VALEAPSELTPPTLASLKTFPMRVTLQPDGLGELLQWGHQTGTPGTAVRVTMGLVDAAQPLFSPFNPMPRSPVTGCHD